MASACLAPFKKTNVNHPWRTSKSLAKFEKRKIHGWRVANCAKLLGFQSAGLADRGQLRSESREGAAGPPFVLMKTSNWRAGQPICLTSVFRKRSWQGMSERIRNAQGFCNRNGVLGSSQKSCNPERSPDSVPGNTVIKRKLLNVKQPNSTWR
jgi:hypothetical protein